MAMRMRDCKYKDPTSDSFSRHNTDTFKETLAKDSERDSINGATRVF